MDIPMKALLCIVFFLSATVAWAAGDAPGAAGATVKGQVLEIKDVDAYTYLRLKTKDGEQWAAVNKAPVKQGAEVTIENASVMKNFESKTLKRKFDTIVFGSLAGGAATPVAATAAGTPPAGGGKDLGAMHSGMSKAVDVGDVKVQKASGADARTVAEIVGKPGELKNKPVVVRAKVVKFTPAILGKNWIHVRDGTGSDADGTNDVLVTSQAEAKVGDVVLIKGIVRTDVDLGSGYAYKVLVEEATLTK
jgi:hypothetical protein